MDDSQLKILTATTISRSTPDGEIARLIKVRFTYFDYGPWEVIFPQDGTAGDVVNTAIIRFTDEIDIVLQGVPEITNISTTYRIASDGQTQEYINCEFRVRGFGPFSRQILEQGFRGQVLVDLCLVFRRKMLAALFLEEDR